MVDEKDVLKLVRSRAFGQMKALAMARRLGVAEGEMDVFVGLLEQMERRGLVVRVKKDQWVNPAPADLAVGRLRCNPRGFSFLLPVLEGGSDIYVAEEDMRDAMDGDLAVVEIRGKRSRRRGERGRRRTGPSGRVIRVIEHVNRRVVGRFIPGSKFCRVVPDNPRLFRDIYVSPQDSLGAEPDELVVVELTSWPDLRRNAEGEVREILGMAGAPGVDVQSVMLEFGLPRAFSAEARQAAEALPAEPPGQEMARRRDLRDRATITIDPEDAKDYDDALSLQREPQSGNRVVGVHIADLSFYVRPGDALDREARERGCSVYLANEVVPMLPHAQSKDLLSLNEGKERLAKTVFLEFDEAGRLVGHSLCWSVVKVDRRMTYTEVQEILDALDSEEPARRATVEKLTDEIYELIVGLDALAIQLRALRHRIGSIDLDVPDYHVSIGEDGRVVGVAQIVRDRSHALVEEFMLAANCAVATLMDQGKLPALYRVHEPPLEEDLLEFEGFVKAVGGRKVNAGDRGQLQNLLADVAQTSLCEAVNLQLLRAMQRALYSPRLQPHYALHFDRYCHFTSPVRRYPDLVVHQILDQHFIGARSAGSLRQEWQAALPRVALHCNSTQERADEAERQIIKIKLLRYLEQHAGEVFDAVVTGVQEYGLFVRLDDYLVEGLIKVRALRDDFYRYDERGKALIGTRGGRTFRLGQPLRVTLERIDMARRLVDFLPYK